MESQESWKPVVGLENVYEVSSQGRLRRMTDGKFTFAGRILNSTKMDNGYRIVKLSNGKNRSQKLVHAVVMATFCGPRPKGMDINHKNGIRDDNRIENLEYATRSENHLHAYRVLGRPVVSNKGSKAGRAKLTESDVLEIRKRYAAGGVSQDSLAKEYGVSQHTISCIILRKNWTHI